MDAGRATRHVHLTATRVSIGSPSSRCLAAAVRVEHSVVVGIDLEREKDPKVLRQAVVLVEAKSADFSLA